MIGWLSGKLIDKPQPGRVVINVNGVGYDVETSLQTFLNLELQVADLVVLHIHTIVREDAFLLYGFLTKDERSLFRALIKINGVGPKVAMAILSSVTPLQFFESILQKNTGILNKIPGIGKKTAERLIIEMKDSVNQLFQQDGNTLFVAAPLTINQQQEAISALETLGFKTPEASKAVKKVDDGHKTCQQLIKMALQLLTS
jgi:Holliday junction DNA helicase RuvA